MIPTRAAGAFLVLVSLLSGPLAADTVVLRNGTTYRNVRATIRGDVLIVVVQGDARLRVPVRDVLRIIPGAVQDDSPVAPAAPPVASDPAQGTETDHRPPPMPTPRHELTALEVAAGPLPGFSPYYFHDHPIRGALSGGLELLTLYPALVLAANPQRAPLERYLPLAYAGEVLSPSGAGQGYGGGNAAVSSLASTITRAWMIQTTDRMLYGPVRDPLHGGGYTGIDRYLAMRSRAYALFATAVLLDSLALVLFHPGATNEQSDTRRNAQEPRWRVSLQLAPDIGTTDRFTPDGWSGRPGPASLHFQISRAF